MRRTLFTVVAWLVGVPPASAGLLLELEPVRPLPARFSGFLADVRLLQELADPANPPPLRDSYVDARLRLEAGRRERPLTADESAELGGVLIRLGEIPAALAVLQPAARAYPEHYRLASHLGTALQLAGESRAATESLTEAVRLAPTDDLRAAERLQRSLASGRKADDLAAAGLAVVQQTLVWLPGDGRLFRRLGELVAGSGDVRTAARLMDAAASDARLTDAAFLARRQELRAAADALDAAEKPSPPSALVFRSARLLKRSVDPARLAAVTPGGVTPFPWALLRDVEHERSRWEVGDYFRSLDGRRVRVVGYITPGGAVPAGGLTDFLLTPASVGCWYCDAPGPTQTLAVELAPGLACDPVRAAVGLVGTLRLNPADPEAYPARLEDARLVPLD